MRLREQHGTINARIAPHEGMDLLSRREVARLRDASAGGLARCGSAHWRC